MILQVSVVCKMDVDAMKSVMVLLEDTRREAGRGEVKSPAWQSQPASGIARNFLGADIVTLHAFLVDAVINMLLRNREQRARVSKREANSYAYM